MHRASKARRSTADCSSHHYDNDSGAAYVHQNGASNCFATLHQSLVYLTVSTPSHFDFRFGSTTDLTAPKFDFRSSPKSGLKSHIRPCPVRARTGHLHSKRSRYSITALALATNPSGISRPSAFAVLRLITSSKRAS